VQFSKQIFIWYLYIFLYFNRCEFCDRLCQSRFV